MNRPTTPNPGRRTNSLLPTSTTTLQRIQRPAPTFWQRLLGVRDIQAPTINQFNRQAAVSTRGSERRRINLSLIIATMAIVGVGSFVARSWHKWQFARQTTMFRDASQRAVDARNYMRAERYLRNYLAIVPTDAQAHADLAEIVDKGSGGITIYRLRAVRSWANAIDLEPTRDDWRAKLAELQLIEAPRSALENADAILNRDPKNVDALRIKAKAMDRLLVDFSAQMISIRDVVKAYENYLRVQSGDAEIAMRLAVLLREHAEEMARSDRQVMATIERRADRIMDDLVGRSELTAASHVTRYLYRKRYKNIQSQAKSAIITLDEDLAQALALEPSNASTRLLVAEDLVPFSLREPLVGEPSQDVAPARLQAAMAHAESSIMLGSHDYRPYVAKATLQTWLGNPAGATETILKGVERAKQTHPLLLTRLIEGLERQDKWDEVESRLNQLDDVFKAGYRPDEKAVSDNDLPVAARLLRYWALMAPKNPRRNPVRAAAALREAQERSRGHSMTLPTSMGLGQALIESGKPDFAIEALADALRLAPDSYNVRILLGDALKNANRPGQAIGQYDQALQLMEKAANKPDDKVVRMKLARAQLGAMAKTPVDRRDLAPLDKLVARLKEQNGPSPTIGFFEVASLALRPGDQTRKQASEKIAALEKTYGEGKDAAAYWNLAFLAFIDLGQVDRAAAALEKVEGLAKGDRNDLRRILKAAQSPSAEPSAPALASFLASGASAAGARAATKKASPADRLRLPGAAAAEPLLADAEAAFKAKDAATLRAAEQALASKEGAAAALAAYPRVLRLALELSAGHRDAIGEARTVASQLQDRFPDWSASRTASALIAEAAGRPDEAIDAYKQAVELGESRPESLRRMLNLLLSRDRLRDAQQQIDRMPTDWLTTPELAPLAVRLAIRQRQPERALELARQVVTARPKDADAHVLLAQATVIQPDPSAGEQAEAALRTAIALAPQDVGVWIDLVYFHVANEKLPRRALDLSLSAIRARELLRANSAQLTRSQQLLILSRCYEMLGDIASADAMRGLGASGDSGSVADAVGLAALAVDKAPPSVRKTFGLFFIQDGSTTDLLTATDSSGGNLTLTVVAYLLRGDAEGRREAISLLAAAKENKSIGERWLGARLARLAANSTDVEKAYRELAETGPTEAIVEWSIDAFARRRLSEGRDGIEALRKRTPPPPDLANLQVYWLALDGKKTEAAAMARRLVAAGDAKASPQAELARALVLADFLANAGAEKEAADLVKESSAAVPEGEAALVDWLVDQPNQFANALDRSLKIATRSPTSESVRRIAKALRHGKASPAQEERINQALSRGSFSDPAENAAFLAAIAEVRHRQGKSDDALKALDHATRLTPNDGYLIDQRNRLILDTGASADDMLARCDKAIQLAGPALLLLRTKARALIADGQTQAAVALLQGNLLDANPQAPDAVYLADACQRANLADELAGAKRLAKALGTRDLDPSERELLHRLDK